MAKSKYKDDFPKRIKEMAEKPMIEKDMADNLGVSVVTFEVYKKKYVKFAKALKKGKEEPDEMVESALFRRAMGYSHPDVHITNYLGEIKITKIVKHYPPDPTACIFWLKNRRPDLWRDRHELEHSGSIVTPVILNRVTNFLTLIKQEDPKAYEAFVKVTTDNGTLIKPKQITKGKKK